MTDPKIYVGTYAKYNAGDLSGDWLSLRDFETFEDLIEACMELHSDEADPELMIQDCDDMPDGLTVGESIWARLETGHGAGRAWARDCHPHT